MDPDDLSWDSVLEAVRTDYPELWRSWFNDLGPGELSHGELRIHAPDSSYSRYLRAHCAEAFRDSIMGITGRLVTVRFTAPSDDNDEILAQLTAEPLECGLINPDYTFEQFVVGPSNRLAHAACQAACAEPGALYNPLFLHGPSGLGKTHLLQAVANRLAEADPAPDVVYVTCESFVNDYVRAIETGDLFAFRERVRRADVLVLDDVQFLADRESCQEEVFHTFNVLYHGKRQIVLSADLPPADIPTLEDRLVSRFNWGLVSQVDPPNRETRQAILQKKASLRGVAAPVEVLDLLAERLDSNVRVLEGALTRLASQAQLTHQPITLETARDVLAEIDTRPARALNIRDILEAISEHFGVRLSELVGRKRSRSIAQPRQIGMYLARKLTPLSLEEIGAHFGGRDHSTVLHAERAVEANCHSSQATASTVNSLTRTLLRRRG